ncbi:MAG: phage gp6-like head-tail connector protein [Ruminococcus sp.]|nr:phage gp6-like head-tail connector protein [Ruminococcus sp.]
MDLVIPVQAVTDYLGIEYDEIDEIIKRNIERQISAADRFLQGAIGKDYDADDPRVKELLIMTAAELYTSRGLMNARQEASLRRIAADFLQQLRLERRGDDA